MALSRSRTTAGGTCSCTLDIKSKIIGKLASTKSASWYKIPFDLCSLLEVPTGFITAWRGEPSWKRVFSASSARLLVRV